MIAMRITFFTLALSIAASPAFLVSEALLSLRRLRVDTPVCTQTFPHYFFSSFLDMD